MKAVTTLADVLWENKNSKTLASPSTGSIIFTKSIKIGRQQTEEWATAKNILMNELLKIGQVATQLGMNPKTIRYYEEIGFIPPLKRTDVADLTSHGNRLFSQQDIKRLELIKRLKPLDISLSQIKEILDSVDSGCCTESRPQLQKLIAEKLDDLKRLQHTLETIFISQSASKKKKKISCEGSNDPCGCVMGK